MGIYKRPCLTKMGISTKMCNVTNKKKKRLKSLKYVLQDVSNVGR